MFVLRLSLIFVLLLLSASVFAEESSPLQEADRASVTLNFSDHVPEYSGKVMSLDVQDTDIQTVLNVIAKISGLNFIVAPEVRGHVTLSVKDMPWDEVFHTIVKTYNLHFRKAGNIVTVTKP